MKVIFFLMYYLKLRLGVLLGFYQTAIPLGVKWRWYHWQHKYQQHRARGF